MRKMHLITRRSLSFLLAVIMLLGVVGCAKAPTSNTVKVLPMEKGNQNTIQKLEESALGSREELEQVIEVLGNGENTDNMTDEEINNYVEELIQGLDNEKPVTNVNNDSGVVNLGTNKAPLVADTSETVKDNDGTYDENGAMTKPFDEVYPEFIENGKVEYDDETVLVKLNNSQNGKITEGMKKNGVALLTPIVPLENQTWYEARLIKDTDVASAIEGLRSLDEVKLVEYNFEIQTANIDICKECYEKWGHHKNPYHNKQWHMHHCGITDGLEESETVGGDSSVIVAVIDTGVDYDHEDLSQNIWVNTAEIPGNNIDDDKNGYVDDYYGVNIVAGKGNGDDDNGHGTHVAGIIAAQNNNVGVVGIAPNVKIMPIKAAMANGTLHQSDIAKAVLYAYENGAEIINMSFGGTACSIAVQDALAVAYSRCVLVASAGNNGAPNEGLFAIPNYPAALTYVLGVMSVDENGVESSFSNYDVNAFNGVEYELYAPGEAIMSTLPNNQYGILSGTSMAAPTVSAIAAILRSEFTDRDTYPTKFIYGQLASTSDYYATCIDPEDHGPHNLPQIVNLDAALTKLPKPEVSVQDFALFDTEGLRNDDAKVNNGDGVIDAGETFALGLTLRNRWGMSKDTIVSVNANNNGIPDPYISFITSTVNYGSVGTYSTQDCGKIYTDELLTAWENPFYVRIANDCPNDYRFTIYLTVTCKNALDEADESVYTSTSRIDLAVRNGKILPSIIDEDMVLTADNLYIIPNATVINEGVTVRVEPGTHIQFWSDDANDPYASDYIAYLLVNGKFLVEGTKENPVYIYPSDLMDQYNIEMAQGSGGYISLKYADVTNLAANHGNSNLSQNNSIGYADHCTFKVNYGDGFKYRYISSGNVKDSNTSRSSMIMANFGNVTNSVFYKIGAMLSFYIQGAAEKCIFVECGLEFSRQSNSLKTKDCVFLKNSFVDQKEPSFFKNSSYSVQNVNLAYSANNITKVVYREETGTTYILANQEFSSDYLEMIGCRYAIIETNDEADWLSENLSYTAYIGTKFDKYLGKNVWIDGTEIGDFLDLAGYLEKNYRLGYTPSSKTFSSRYDTSFYLYEISGDILPKEITFFEYEVLTDMESAYQISPITAPIQLGLNRFIYESSDESILKVDENGVVTPIGMGKADVYVYYKDRAVHNYVSFEVNEYVPLEKIELQKKDENTLIAVGEALSTKVVLSPENTTRRNVKFSSSDESVATVDAVGNIYGISSGTTTITATCEEMMSTVEVTVFVKATSLELGESVMQVGISETQVELPEVITSNGAETELSWRLTDTSVAVIENGKLIPKTTGTSTLVVKDERSGLSANCIIMVLSVAPSPVKDMVRRWSNSQGSGNAVLLENGNLYYWDNKYSWSTSDVVEFSLGHFSQNIMVVRDSGVVENLNYINGSVNKSFNDFKDKTIKSIYGFSYLDDSYFVITEEGIAYAWGSGYKLLGLGATGEVSAPQMVQLENVKDVLCNKSYGYFLTESGEVYVSSSGSLRKIELSFKVKEFLNIDSNDTVSAINESGQLCSIYINSGSVYDTSPADKFDVFSVGSYNKKCVGIIDGNVYEFSYANDTITPVPGITDAIAVCSYDSVHLIATKKGLVYKYWSSLEQPKLVNLEPIADEDVVLTGTNLSEDKVLSNDKIILSFNKQIKTATAKLLANGEQIVGTVSIENVNDVVVTCSGFGENVDYKLVFAVDSIVAEAGTSLSNSNEIIVEFTYKSPETNVESKDDTVIEEDTEIEEIETVIHESVLDTSIERIYTAESFVAKLQSLVEEHQINPSFYGNAILNPISTDTEVTHWLRPIAPTVSAGTYKEIPFGGNYWGTTNEKAIQLQMTDYTDFITYARLMYAPYLTEAPENTFPFVTSVTLINKAGEAVTTVGNEEVTFRVTFNRDMDTSIPLRFTFGSAYPYADYTVEDGKFVDARTWEGKYTLNTVIENGNQFVAISNGCSATEDLTLQPDNARFGFVIDTTDAQALIMQGEATDTGINLRWTQDDFDTLMGYNVYRSTSLNGLYQRLNSTVIPFDTMEFFDDTVEPGVVYYYNFTVVKTDLTESTPSGKITIMSKDTMAPNIYHSPVYSATIGQNLIISADVTDNLTISYANLYFRTKGQTEWKTVRMNNLNDKYSAIIPASSLELEGLEYYIEAFDGVSYTYRGSASEPYAVTVKESIDKNSLGDVDGDGTVTNKDALILLLAISHKYNMTEDEFKRADLNSDEQLSAVEALRILHYVTGKVGSLDMTA